MDFLIEKVFIEFQRNLKILLEKHDKEINLLHVTTSDDKKELFKEILKLERELKEELNKIQKVFHDNIEREVDKIKQDLGKLKVESINLNWKIILGGSIAGIGGSQGVTHLLGFLF